MSGVSVFDGRTLLPPPITNVAGVPSIVLPLVDKQRAEVRMIKGHPSTKKVVSGRGNKTFVSFSDMLPTLKVGESEFFVVNDALASALGLEPEGRVVLPYGPYGSAFNPDNFNPEFMTGSDQVPMWLYILVAVSFLFFVICFIRNRQQ